MSFDRLRPPEPTPQSELCKCPSGTHIKLMQALGYNPIHCIKCNLEVPPENIGLTEEHANSIAAWSRLYAAFEELWLSSGAYEAWALEQMSDINSDVNKQGRRLQRDINSLRRCYYWLFQDDTVDEFSPFSVCPSCNRKFSEYSEGIFKQLICEECSIITVGE